ncbi:BTB/POZ domain-containing protein npy3 [Phtheirospermum japonicum]|uniref:BTB/POZ domain-containing protein npy3 n=1 Tax=Phtheirospermum japonicum TaxID=374723 RepID=A0A830AX59_9LAMI|nr:BTB/POZ domain-containing protein npy3 [Phtheirospermum japonicum]
MPMSPRSTSTTSRVGLRPSRSAPSSATAWSPPSMPTTWSPPAARPSTLRCTRPSTRAISFTRSTSFSPPAFSEAGRTRLSRSRPQSPSSPGRKSSKLSATASTRSRAGPRPTRRGSTGRTPTIGTKPRLMG